LGGTPALHAGEGPGCCPWGSIPTPSDGAYAHILGLRGLSGKAGLDGPIEDCAHPLGPIQAHGLGDLIVCRLLRWRQTEVDEVRKIFLAAFRRSAHAWFFHDRIVCTKY